MQIRIRRWAWALGAVIFLMTPAAGYAAPYADIVVDAATGRVLREMNATDLRHPASLTKMMTLYMTFKALDDGRLRLDQRITASAHSASQPPSKLGLRPGQGIMVEDAILGLVTESANDVAATLGEAMGGSESAFAQRMTQQAAALGMTRTRFYNASGLPDPRQVTCARDMAILARALMMHFPRYYPYFSYSRFNWNGRSFHNHNRLMNSYEGMDGLKTGYIRASGFNLVASAVRGQTRLIAVVLGGKSTQSRNAQVAALLDRGFAGDFSQSRVASIQAPSRQKETQSPQRTASWQGNTKDYALAQSEQRGEGDKGEVQQASSGDNEWGIQVGSFRKRADGQRALKVARSKLPKLLADAEPRIEKVSTHRGAIWRAQWLGLDASSARAACRVLSRKGHECLTMPSAS
ncbi:MAG: D-alanyl-D-alanine carboxypeptidase [Alphaproteobacteria bacterium]|nr:MAG: D-alanyl-D-alanine carboxypeptidase [Alphaproteobacteria bacterium]